MFWNFYFWFGSLYPTSSWFGPCFPGHSGYGCCPKFTQSTVSTGCNNNIQILRCTVGTSWGHCKTLKHLKVILCKYVRYVIKLNWTILITNLQKFFSYYAKKVGSGFGSGSWTIFPVSNPQYCRQSIAKLPQHSKFVFFIHFRKTFESIR